MPGRPYTARLWVLLSSSVGSNLGPTVPSGHIWIVRDVNLVNESGNPWEYAGRAQLLSDLTGSLIYGIDQYQARYSTQFHDELRQVMEEGEQFKLFTEHAGWWLTVTGYDFLLP